MGTIHKDVQLFTIGKNSIGAKVPLMKSQGVHYVLSWSINGNLHTCGLWRGDAPTADSGTETLPAAPLSRVQYGLDNVLRHHCTPENSYCHHV